MATRKNQQTQEPTIDEEISREERRKGDVEVDVSEDDPDDGEEVEDVAPQAPTRKEKKAARGTLRQEADDLRAENARLAQEASEARAAAALREGYIQGRTAAGSGGKDPLDERLEQIRQEQSDLMTSFDALPDAAKKERLQAMRQKAFELRERETDVMFEKRERQRAPSPEQRAQQQQIQQIQARYGDVVSNPTAWSWVAGRYRQLMAEGHPDTGETTDLVMNEARARFGQGAKRPDGTMERKLQAQPKGASGPSGGTRVVLTPKDQEMADAAFAEEKDPKKRLQLYARLVSKKSA